MGASPWHRWRWLPAGYCGKLLLAASWLIQQNLTGSVSVYQGQCKQDALSLSLSTIPLWLHRRTSQA
jgi:hypothetical protein